MPRILTGITPSGTLHIGNYFGAMRPAIELQAGGDAYYFIADYHSMTALTDAAERRAYTRGIALDWLACGLDPAKAVFWRQSDVPEVCELTWLIGTLTPMGLLERAHSYKDKTARGIAPNFGLFAYPVLMAADILLYDTDIVPVGEDQKQHIELARDIATRFNHMFGETLKVPVPSVPPSGARVMGLDEPTVKMSKSIAESRPNHAILMDHDLGKARKAIMKAVTDAGCEYAPDKASPGILNLMGILSAIGGEPVSGIAARFEGRGYGYLKGEVADAVVAELTPVQAEYQRLISDPDYLDGILSASTAKARGIAEGVMARVRAAVGIG